MKHSNLIQIVITAVSIILIIAAVVMFSIFKAGGGNTKKTPVVLWGTIPTEKINSTLESIRFEEIQINDFQYVEKNAETIEQELLKAIAENKSPDLIIMSEKQLISNQNRIQMIPFESFPLRKYTDTFFDEASLLVTKDGFMGFPFLVDPLVMYYNKDILINSGFSKPPQTWTEVLAITPTITQKDSSFNVSRSSIALGTFENIQNAKDIYWTLVLQAGNPVITRAMNIQKDKEIYQSIFNESLNSTLKPAYAATNFFVQFSNPTKTVYSWNNSLADSLTRFVSGDLAFYLGKSSELDMIRQLNPNLNFDVAIMPQSQSSVRQTTYGSMYVLVVPKVTKNLNNTFALIQQLISPDIQKMFVQHAGLTSVRRDVLAQEYVDNKYQTIFNKSAIMSQGVLEPDPNQVTQIIRELITNISSGQTEISEAISLMHNKLSILLNHDE
jgi:ABC-type glycerol-3-phosphate transport system substrate-binding protein